MYLLLLQVWLKKYFVTLNIVICLFVQNSYTHILHGYYSRSTTCIDETAGPKASDPEKTHKWQIILEPALVGAMIAINLGQTSLQNFYLRTACSVDLGYSMDICRKGVGEEFRSAEVKLT